mmetsp:Transcript_45248/g.175699  ORF Transcript_45248/g.175699 Transcript_45248/m.175699 type:complete len:213 (+) Transcript_45248:844-1482(+)
MAPFWRNIFIYHAICAGVGWRYGYVRRVFNEIVSLPMLKAVPLKTLFGGFAAMGVSAAVTLAANVPYSKAVERCGRKPSWPATAIFALSNGIFESFAFLASFDYGVRLMSKMTSNRYWLFNAGLMLCTAYNGFIHALFWVRYGLPPHTKKPNASVQKARGPPKFLQGFLAMLASWLLVYYRYERVTMFIGLHIVADTCLAHLIALPQPTGSS